MEQQIIKGNTKLVGLLGNPVSHSISPLIHNHAFRKLNLPFVYVPLEVQKKDLHIAIQALCAFNFAGANVTIPYKSAVLSYCDILSELSELTGTVNTLYFDNGLMHGTTTDSDGFFQALLSMNHDVHGGNIVILGNGGTARALGFTLVEMKKINTLTIIGRNKKRVDNLIAEIIDKTGFSVAGTTFGSKKCADSLAECTLLINCTSVGMSPDTDCSPFPQQFFHNRMTVFDVIYNPAETLFLRYAKNAGCQTQNGLRMLLYQGLASFKYWTGIEPDKNLIDIDELQSMILCLT